LSRFGDKFGFLRGAVVKDRTPAELWSPENFYNKDRQCRVYAWLSDAFALVTKLSNSCHFLSRNVSLT
jgi:hypothetical protein